MSPNGDATVCLKIRPDVAAECYVPSLLLSLHQPVASGLLASRLSIHDALS